MFQLFRVNEMYFRVSLSFIVAWYYHASLALLHLILVSIWLRLLTGILCEVRLGIIVRAALAVGVLISSGCLGQVLLLLLLHASGVELLRLWMRRWIASTAAGLSFGIVLNGSLVWVLSFSNLVAAIRVGWVVLVGALIRVVVGVMEDDVWWKTLDNPLMRQTFFWW